MGDGRWMTDGDADDDIDGSDDCLMVVILMWGGIRPTTAGVTYSVPNFVDSQKHPRASGSNMEKRSET